MLMHIHHALGQEIWPSPWDMSLEIALSPSKTNAIELLAEEDPAQLTLFSP